MYGSGARAMQGHFDSRRLADRLVEITVHEAFTDADIELVAAQTSFYLSTVDAEGWPDVSYKGGDVGFVRVLDDGSVVFPSYDGNGMFRSLGNIEENGRVALLFVDNGRPWRIRVHGTATVMLDGDVVDSYPGAEAVVVVTPSRIFPNCGRYIHIDGEVSEFVPSASHTPPEPEWKKLEAIRPYLPGATTDSAD